MMLDGEGRHCKKYFAMISTSYADTDGSRKSRPASLIMPTTHTDDHSAIKFQILNEQEGEEEAA